MFWKHELQTVILDGRSFEYLPFFFFSLNSFVYYLRFIVPSSLQFICSRVRIINGSLNLFLITLPNAYTESLSCETQLGDAACDSWEWEEVSTQRMRMIN